ncbi:MAG: phosphoribosyl-AMP cyclohydrolase [Galbitalea sp.]
MTDAAVDDVEAVIGRVAFDSRGLIPAVIQEEGTREVLMLGYMDDEAIRRTLTEGRVTFWSRSRQEYWRKGDTSGHRQYVRGAALDCDGDALLVTVHQIGPACHTGEHSCFDVDPLEPVLGEDGPGIDDVPGSVNVLGSEDDE